VNFIGYNDLLKNKKASGRLRDLDDLDQLTWIKFQVYGSVSLKQETRNKKQETRNQKLLRLIPLNNGLHQFMANNIAGI
jgi:hypothetical protein